MTCLHPIRLRPDSPMLVPCRRCMACRIQHAREWAVRLVHELNYWDSAAFITLTYNDDKLPKDNGLHKSDLQKFFKRLRKNTSRKYVYYACGEYGGRFLRPHYHMILFGFRPTKKKDDSVIKESWQYGYNYCGNVTYDSCRYVAGYIIDKLNGPQAEKAYGDLEPPFQLQSKGIGSRWAADHKEELLEGKEFTFQGRPIGVPAYYKRKYDFDSKNKASALNLERFNNKLEHIDTDMLKYNANLRYELARMDVESRKQAELNLNAKMNIYKK